jgi:Na+-driven multidrug efflux pump
MLTRRVKNILASALLVLSCQSVRAFASSHSSVVLSKKPGSRNRIDRTRLTTTNGDAVHRGGSSSILESLPSLPTLAQYQKFAIPCLALWISGPLLSLVDTTFIGRSGLASQSAQQLAALGPATTFFDGATYLFMFLNVATTNLYSSARAQEGEQSVKAESVVRTAASVSFRCGLGIMLFLFAFSRPLLSLYIGEKAASTPGLLDAACDYVKIRALSMPTTLVLGVLQAALLGAKDSVTPLVAIMYATIVNVSGDFLLVNRLGWGLQGAAIATTAAQWASTAALLGPARKRLVRDHKLGIISRPRVEGGISGRTFLGFAAPVLTLVLGKLAAFGFMTHAAAAAPGQPTPLAAHQIVLSLLFFCSPFLEVISQVAQTFLPPFVAPVNDHVERMRAANADYKESQDVQVQKWHAASTSVATTLLGLGIAAATVVASVASLVPAYFGGAITSDSSVQQAVKPLAKYLWLGTFFWAPIAVSEGVLLARRELKFLAGVYLASTALLPPALLRVKFRGGDVGQVWACFAVFQLFRAVLFSGRLWGGPFLERLLGRFNKKTPTNGEIVIPLNGEIAAAAADEGSSGTDSSAATPPSPTEPQEEPKDLTP